MDKKSIPISVFSFIVIVGLIMWLVDDFIFAQKMMKKYNIKTKTEKEMDYSNQTTKTVLDFSEATITEKEYKNLKNITLKTH